MIARAGDAALLAGRLDTVAGWIDTLPPDVLADNPLLQVYRGDVFRLRTDFDKALAWYAQAEQTCRARGDKAGISRALRGQASIYLDIVQPAEGEHVLEEALRLIDGMADREAHARLLELVAENKLNMGEPDKAAALWAEARALREEAPDEDVVSVRVKFRTGRLIEARDILETLGRGRARRRGTRARPARRAPTARTCCCSRSPTHFWVRPSRQSHPRAPGSSLASDCARPSLLRWGKLAWAMPAAAPRPGRATRHP